jgi:hypothetical protein
MSALQQNDRELYTDVIVVECNVDWQVRESRC